MATTREEWQVHSTTAQSHYVDVWATEDEAKACQAEKRRNGMRAHMVRVTIHERKQE